MDYNPDLQYRYPGTKPFEWNESNLFKGRDEDIQNLYDLISIESMVVLYGRSGLGKTSLLNAGLASRFKEDTSVTPLFFRFYNYFSEKPDTPVNRLYADLGKQYGWLNQNFLYEKILPQESITDYKLWYLFKSIQITEGKKKDTFILIFDQFEELFTYPDKDISLFAAQLAELFFVKIPQQLRNVLKEKLSLDKDALTEDEIALLYAPLQIKILFAIRSDKLSLMNVLTGSFPSVLKWCYELTPLSSESARDAIVKPALLKDKEYAAHPFTFKEEALDLILKALLPDATAASGKAVSEQGIETFQLQIVCKYIENKVIESGIHEVTPNDIGNVKAVFENHYRDIMAKFPPEKQLPARRLIENNLIIDGARVPMPVSFIMKEIEGMTPELLNELVNTHLIRIEQNNTVEISHDTLIEPILKESTNEFAALKQQGDFFYKQERYEDAVTVLSRFIEATKKAPPADVMEVYRLRGDAYVKLKQYQKSNEDFAEVIKANPTDISALFSTALNFFSLNDDEHADEFFVKAAELNPYNAANTYNEAGVTYFTIKLYDKAKLYFEKAIEKNPGYFYPHYNLGLIYGDRNETEKAMQEFSMALRIKPDSEDANNAAGNLYYKLKDYGKAKTYFEASVSINPDNAMALYFLGNIEVQNYNYEPALVLFQKAIDINGEYLEAYLQKAVMLGILQRYDEGVECLNKAIEINPKSDDAYSRLGLMYVNKGDLEKALSSLTLANSLTPTANTYYYLGLTYSGMEKPDEALSNYIKAIELDPYYVAAYKQSGLLLLEMKRYDNIIAGFENIDPSMAAKTGVYEFLQQAHYFKQNDEKSRWYGLKILESDPDNYNAILYLALVERFNSRYKESLQYYTTLLRLAARPAILYNEMAKIAVEDKDYETAIGYAQSAINADSSTAEYYFNLGNIYYDLGNYESAKRYYETAVSIDSGYYYSLYNLALAEENVGNLQKAIEYYKRTIEINPKYDKAYMQLGILLHKIKEYDDSIYYLTELTRFLSSADAFIELGDIYAEGRNDYSKAKECYNEAIAADRDKELSYLRLGWADYMLKNKEEALSHYREAINKNANSFEAYYEIGNILLDDSNFEEAVGYYETAIQLNPGYTSAFNNLGHCYFYLQPLKKAELSFRKAIDSGSDNPFLYITYTNLAEVQIKQGRYDEALQSCKRTLELKPDYDVAFQHAAMAYEKKGDIAKAKENLQKAAQLNPANATVRAHLAELEKAGIN